MATTFVDGSPEMNVRLTTGDTDGTYFSDAEVSNALNNLANGSILRAAGYLFQQLAVSQDLAGQNIRAGQFAINTMGKGTNLLQIATSFFARADAQDAQAASEDADGVSIVAIKPARQAPIEWGTWEIPDWGGFPGMNFPSF